MDLVTAELIIFQYYLQPYSEKAEAVISRTTAPERDTADRVGK